jgi:hypothetical protein
MPKLRLATFWLAKRDLAAAASAQERAATQPYASAEVTGQGLRAAKITEFDPKIRRSMVLAPPA